VKPIIKTGTWSLIASAVRRRWPMVLVAIVVTPIAAVTANKAMPNRYKATSRVLIQESKAINPIMNDKMVDWNVKNRILVMQELVRGNAILEKVLRQRGEITEADTPNSIEEKILSFRREVEVFGVANTMAQLSVTRGTPDATYETLKILVSTFISEMLRPQKESISESAEFLRVQIERLREELAIDERELAAYKAANANELPEVFHLNVDQVNQLKKAIFEAESDLQVALRRKEITEARLRNSSPAKRQVEIKTLEARSRLRDLGGIYTDEHPALETQRALIRKLESEHDRIEASGEEFDLAHLEAMASTRGGDRAPGGEGRTDLLSTDILSYKAVLAEIENARGKLVMLNRRMVLAEQQVRGVAHNERSVQQMQREVESKNKMYRDLLIRYEETLVTRELALYDEKAQVWIVEPPLRPVHATKPASILVGLAGLFGGVVLGVILAAVGELLSGVVRRDRVATIAGVELVGTLGSRGSP